VKFWAQHSRSVVDLLSEAMSFLTICFISDQQLDLCKCRWFCMSDGVYMLLDLWIIRVMSAFLID